MQPLVVLWTPKLPIVAVIAGARLYVAFTLYGIFLGIKDQGVDVFFKELENGESIFTAIGSASYRWLNYLPCPDSCN